MSFELPAKPTDLETAAKGWRVKTLIDGGNADIGNLLQDAAGRVEEDAKAIASNETFDVLYSAVRSFDQLSGAARNHASALAADAVHEAARGCKRALDGSAPDSELAEWRTALKAAVFLQAWLLQEAEKIQAKTTLMPAGAKPAAKKGGKKAAAEDGAAWSWDPLRETAVLRLLEALEVDLSALWGHRAPDEAFLVLFSRAAYTILEQPAALKAGAASLRETLWRLIALPAQKYGQAEATVSALVKLLLGCEHVTTHIAELMQRLLEEHDAVKLVAELLRELASLGASEMSADSAGPKNVASFLHALAARAPLMLVANLELLQPHMDSESYALRCGAVSAYGQLLIQISQLKGAQPPEVAAAAEGLLSVPLQRLNDTSSFVRSRALQTLGLLCESRALPIQGFQITAELGLQRLADKNANVRRGALQLFGTLLEFNPFCPSLDHVQLAQRRDALRQSLGDAIGASAAPSTPTKSTPTKPAEADAATDAPAADAADADAPADAAPEPPPAAAVDPAVRDQQVALQLLELALRFEAVLRAELPAVTKLLSSQTNSDVSEAMQAIVAAHSFELQGARPAVLLTLVWSKEAAVKQAALQAAQTVWLRPSAAKEGGRGGALAHAVGTARGLLQLVEEANLAEITSLEEVIGEWQRQKLLPAALVTTLWETLQARRPELPRAADRRGALALLNMAAAGDGQLLRSKMDLLIQQVHVAKGDLVLARHGCVALQRCAAAGPAPPKAARSIIRAMERLLQEAPPASQSEAWCAVAEQAVEVIFTFADAPEDLCTDVLHRMGAAISEGGEQGVCSAALSRLLFALGHVAIKSLVHFEACEKMLTKRRQAAAEGEAAPAPKEATKAAKGGKKGKAAAAQAEADALADELGTSAASAEADSDYILSLGERLLAPGALLGTWAPLVTAVCANSDGQFGPELRANAVLTLCKFMCVSAGFCEEHLQLLFSVMKHEPEQAIRANIAVTLGDLAVRHPNLLEPWTAHLYAQLRDKELRVRKNVLMVLTHLILNDMIKVKGQVSELALCLLDAEPRVSSNARLFFHEFAKKSSAPVYNLLPDIVSTLSRDTAVSPDDFREVVGFLITFLQKDKQTESMVEKLCMRFDGSDAVQHHRDVAFCVGSLSHTEKSVRKLIDLFKTFGNKLGDAEVYNSFTGLAQKSRKFAKPELKAAVDELEGMLAEAVGQAPEQPAAADEAADEGGAAADGAAEGEPTPAKPASPAPDAPAEPEPEPVKAAPKAKAAKPPAKGRRGKAAAKAEPEEEEADEADADENKPPPPKAKAAPKAATKAKKVKEVVKEEAPEEPAAPARASRSRRAAAAK